jgi:hypothetical protein
MAPDLWIQSRGDATPLKMQQALAYSLVLRRKQCLKVVGHDWIAQRSDYSAVASVVYRSIYPGEFGIAQESILHIHAELCKTNR